MANPSGDVYEDIAEMWRVIEGLSTAARMPQVSNSGIRKQAMTSPSRSTGVPPSSFGATNIVDQNFTLAARIPASRQVLLQFAFTGTITVNAGTVPGTAGTVTMRSSVLVGGEGLVPPATPFSLGNGGFCQVIATTSVASDLTVSQQVMETLIMDFTTLDPSITKYVINVDYKYSGGVAGTRFVNSPWLTVDPL